MKMSITYTKILAVVLVVAMFGACDLFDERGRTIEDNNVEAQLEFFPLSQTRPDTTGGADASTEVQLIAAQRGSDLTVTYQVDPNSTAIDGTHYTITSGESPLNLAANTNNAGPVAIEIIDDSVPDGEVRQLILVLQDSEDVIASPNLRTYTLSIQGIDQDDI